MSDFKKGFLLGVGVLVAVIVVGYAAGVIRKGSDGELPLPRRLHGLLNRPQWANGGHGNGRAKPLRGRGDAALGWGRSPPPPCRDDRARIGLAWLVFLRYSLPR